jgi:terminase small subunit-like protein
MNREKSKVTETRYMPEFAEEVCRRMAEGTSLREVCRDSGVPESSVRQWVRDDRDGFAARYQAARTLQVDHGAIRSLRSAIGKTSIRKTSGCAATTSNG